MSLNGVLIELYFAEDVDINPFRKIKSDKISIYLFVFHSLKDSSYRFLPPWNGGVLPAQGFLKKVSLMEKI